MLISVKGKILSARSVRRIPVEHRWGEDCLSWVDRVPWNRYKEALDADEEVPLFKELEEQHGTWSKGKFKTNTAAPAKQKKKSKDTPLNSPRSADDNAAAAE